MESLGQLAIAQMNTFNINLLCMLLAVEGCAVMDCAASVQQDDVIVTSEDDWFRSLCAGFEITTVEDCSQHYRRWAEGLDPVLSPSDLSTLIKSKRESIGAIYTKVDVTNQAENARTWRVVSEFARRDTSLFHRLEVLESGDLEAADNTLATDGEFEQTIRGDVTRRRGTIRYATGEQVSYHDPWDALPLQMLSDSEQDFGFSWVSYDLVTLLGMENCFVLEDEIAIDGHSCIVVTVGAPVTIRIFLDIERDLAVIRYQHFGYEVANDRPPRRWLSGDRAAKDFREYTPGLWLPRTVSYVAYDANGRRTLTRKHLLLEVRVGEAVDRRMFSDVFAEGMFVRDSTRGVSYYHGRDDNVQEALDTGMSLVGAAANRRGVMELGEDDLESRWRAATDLAIAGVVAGGILILLLWRRRVSSA